jgi:CSLREA domain-containing protein
LTRALVLAALIVALAATPASAAIFTVTKTADTNDGACAAGNCSLRDAVIASNATTGPNVINVPSGHFTLTGAAGEDAAASGDLDVTQPLTVNGAGAGATVIDGGGNDRLFDTQNVGASLTVTGLTLTNGNASDGAAVRALGAVDLEHVDVSGNTAPGSGRGAVLSQPSSGDTTITVHDSTFNSNVIGGGSSAAGFGVVTAFGPGDSHVTIQNSSFRLNNVGGRGDGSNGFGTVFLETSGSAFLTLQNSVFDSNTIGGGGNSSTGFGSVFVESSHAATVNLDSSRFVSNSSGGGGTSSNAFGGGLFVEANSGSTSITQSVFDQNTAGGGDTDAFGGGIFYETTTGTLNISNTTISGNRALGTQGTFGGGLFFEASSASQTMNLTNTTVSGNSAQGTAAHNAFGGGIFIGGGTATLLNATVADNAAGSDPVSGLGGGIYDGSPTTATDTIFSGNLTNGTPQSCANPVTSGGHNIESGTSCGFTDSTDLNANALLAPLGDYGGPTQTRALLPGSPAIDHGAGCPLADQRGMPRPFGPACDIGAYEFAPPVPTTGAATGITPNGAVLTGSVIPNLRPASAHFEYGKTTSYGSQSSPLTVTGALATVAIKATISGLTPGTLYHYRLDATGDATAAGMDLTFTTPFPKPKLSRLRLSPSTFAAAGSGGSTAAKRKTGTNITYTDSQASKTGFKVLRPAAGRRQGKSCRRPSARNRHGRACTRFVVVGSFSHKDKSGRNKVHFTGRVHRHKLAPGKYRMRATPRAHGVTGKPATRAFKIIA